MKKGIVGIFLLFMVCNMYVFATDTKGSEKVVNIAFGLTLPPYVFENETGMEYDIIKKSLALKGYSMKPFYVPFARVTDRKSTRLNSSHSDRSRMPSSA